MRYLLLLLAAPALAAEPAYDRQKRLARCGRRGDGLARDGGRTPCKDLTTGKPSCLPLKLKSARGTES
jgi:hypothetical protein